MAEDARQRAISLALKRLNRRELTAFEMRSHLERHELDPETIEAAIRELTDARYLDDERFARLFVQNRRTLDGWGADRIRHTLRGRGIDRELIEAAIAAEHGDGTS